MGQRSSSEVEQAQVRESVAVRIFASRVYVRQFSLCPEEFVALKVTAGRDNDRLPHPGAPYLRHHRPQRPLNLGQGLPEVRVEFDHLVDQFVGG